MCGSYLSGNVWKGSMMNRRQIVSKSSTSVEWVSFYMHMYGLPDHSLHLSSWCKMNTFYLFIHLGHQMSVLCPSNEGTLLTINNPWQWVEKDCRSGIIPHPHFRMIKQPIQTGGKVKPTWRINQGSPTNSPQTEEATWISSETFQPNKKEVQLPWLNFQVTSPGWLRIFTDIYCAVGNR